jgi:predicted PurR-regulated permease PerM
MATSDTPVCRLNFGAAVSLLILGLVFLLTVKYAGLLVEVGLVVFSAILLSVAVRPLVDALARRRIPRSVTMLGIYVALFIAVAVLAGLLLPVIRSEVTLLQTKGPTLYRSAVSRIAATPLGKLLPSSDSAASSLTQHLDSVLAQAVSTITDVTKVVVDALVIFVLAFFFSTDVGLGKRVLEGWVPLAHRERIATASEHLRFRLTRWIWAQMAVALYFAVVFSIGLSLLNVPFAITIGVVGGVLELVPYLGGTIAVMLAVLSALTVAPVLVIWVILFHIVVVEIEAHIVAPSVYGRVTGLHPAGVLIALLIGAKAMGLVGVLFAVPAAVVLLAVMQEIRSLRHDVYVKPSNQEIG